MKIARLILIFVLICTTNVYGQLTAGFTASTTEGCAPLLVSFTNTTTPSGGTSYSWAFGTTSSSVLTNPSVSFTSPGTHLVTLTATNGSETSSYSISIIVHPAPVANFIASDTTVCPGEPIIFTSTSTSSVPGPMTYSWNFGDGTPTGTGATAAHTYTAPGLYTITLFATNATGCVASIAKSAFIEVYTPPLPNFTWSPFGICNPPGSVTFTPTGTGTPPLTHAWTFGDGGTGSGAPSSHLYTGAGVYNVKLVVTDGNGCKDSMTNGPIVVDTIRADFSYSSTVCVFSSVTFYNTSSSHTSRVWNFGDGSPTVTSFNGTHVYSSPGVYTVTLSISDPPCTHTITHTVNVVRGPTSGFIVSPPDPCPAPATLTFTGTGPAGTIYNWYFDGGGSTTGSPATHTFATNGVKEITLVSTDPVTGCKDTVVGTDTLYDIYMYEVTPSAYDGCVPLTVHFTTDLITSVPSPGPYPWPMASYSWDFGDGSSIVTSPTPTHTYTAVGIYLVTATGFTTNGCPVRDTFTIKVGAPPVVTFTGGPYHVCYGAYEPLTFTPTIITGPVDEWRWNFGEDEVTIYSTFPVPASHVYILPGLFTVSVTPYFHGCPGTPYSISDYVLIDSPKSVMRFEFQCTPRTTVQFYNESLGDDSHIWIFGDGTTSLLDDPLHDFPTFGIYPVQLATYNETSGCHDTFLHMINLIPPAMSLTASDTTICRGDTVQFTFTLTGVSASSGSWMLGYPDWDIMTGTAFTPSFGAPTYFTDTFYNTGYNSVRVIIVDEYDCRDTLIDSAWIQVGPADPDFIATPTEGCNPLTVSFADASTPVPGSWLTSYEWDFGDGGTVTTSATPISHVYTVAGTYTVTQIVTDNIGCRDTMEKPDYITVYQPSAGFSVTNTHPCLNVPVTFNNLSSGGVVSSFWDFGDGATSTATSPVHTYTALGTYTIRLTVTDAHGCTDDELVIGYINVTKPDARFAVSDSVSVCPPLFVNFTNLSTGGSIYNWLFGDGGGSTVMSPSNMYIASGLYNSQLIVTNEHGCKDTARKPINIFGYAGAFSYTPLEGCVPFAVRFTASLSNVPHIIWDFSDGNTSSVSFTDTITHVYTTPGAYVPKLLLSDNTGCQTSSVGIDTIKVEQLIPQFSTEPSPVCIETEFHFVDSSTTYWTPVNDWTWSYDGIVTTDPSPTHTISTPGNYPVTLRVRNSWGCTGTITRDLIVHPPPEVTTSPDTTVCVGDPAILMGYGAVNYTWEPPATLSCTACNPTNATPAVETVYTVTGTDANGCVDTAEVTVRLRTNTVSNAWGDTAICQGVPVQIFDTGGHTYEWIPATGLNSNTVYNPIATPDYTTIYTVIARLGSCIPDTNTVTVFIYPLPTVDAGPDQRLVAGSQAQIQATGSNIVSYLWSPAEPLSCPDCPNPVASMSVTTTFNVGVLSEYGCQASDSVTIWIFCDNSQVFIPNTFTPNNDAQNDVFYPRGIGVSTVKSFRIYNRWGELVFERSNFGLNDESYAWDGSYKGNKPRPDVYVYIMEAVCYTGEDILVKGDVTIIR